MENIHPFGAVEKGIEGKKILEEIVAENSPNLARSVNLLIREAD